MSTILMVVDDEPDVQLLMKQKFRKQIRESEYEFIFAANGVEAMQMLKNHPDIDVILCDVNMPQMDGITLLTKTRDMNPTVQTIIVSAYGDMRNIRRAMNHGAFDFVTKPINFNDLGATIEKTIRHVKKLKDNIREREQLYEELESYSKNLEQTVEKRTAEIVKQKEIIEAKNQSITESINYAKRIQQAALPATDDIKKVLPESFILFRPRDIVSGDFYWFREKEHKIILTAVDCTGHGVPGAFMSLIGNDILHELIDARGLTEPDKILNELHHGVRRALRQDDNNSREGMDMAFCVFDKKEKTISFSGARNPLICIRNNEMEVIKGDRQAIGGTQRERDRHFTKHVISIESETMIYIFSDGYQDQFGGEKGSKFMSKRFKELLFEIHKEDITKQYEILTKTLDDWKGDNAQIDDILVIGIRLSPESFGNS